MWWPIVLGAALLGVFSAVSGVAFAGLADRVFGLTRPPSAIVAGAAWSFVSFVFFWDMVLPIARDGAPFRVQALDPQLSAAPNWVWIVGFTALGLVTGAAYAALRFTGRLMESAEARDERRRSLRSAA